MWLTSPCWGWVGVGRLYEWLKKEREELCGKVSMSARLYIIWQRGSVGKRYDLTSPPQQCQLSWSVRTPRGASWRLSLGQGCPSQMAISFMPVVSLLLPVGTVTFCDDKLVIFFLFPDDTVPFCDHKPSNLSSSFFFFRFRYFPIQTANKPSESYFQTSTGINSFPKIYNNVNDSTADFSFSFIFICLPFVCWEC